MLQQYNTYKVMRIFFDFPTTHFQLRQISRLTSLGLPSTTNHLKELLKEGLIRKERGLVYSNWVASQTELYKAYKRNDMLLRLEECNLIQTLADSTLPAAIVLFGSASRGEDVETSDIDLLLVGSEKKLEEVRKFEKALHRRIALHFEPVVGKIPKELLNNVINGIVVYGYLKVF